MQKDRNKGWRKGEVTGTRGMALLERADDAKGRRDKKVIAMIVLLVAAVRSGHRNSEHALAIPAPTGTKLSGTGCHGRSRFRGRPPRVSRLPRRYESLRGPENRAVASPMVDHVGLRRSGVWCRPRAASPTFVSGRPGHGRLHRLPGQFGRTREAVPRLRITLKTGLAG